MTKKRDYRNTLKTLRVKNGNTFWKWGNLEISWTWWVKCLAEQHNVWPVWGSTPLTRPLLIILTIENTQSRSLQIQIPHIPFRLVTQRPHMCENVCERLVVMWRVKWCSGLEEHERFSNRRTSSALFPGVILSADEWWHTRLNSDQMAWRGGGGNSSSQKENWQISCYLAE